MSPGGTDSGGGGEVGGRQHGEDVEADVVRQQRQRVRAARRAQVVQPGARRQLRGQEVQLRGAEVREQRGHQHRHLAVGELAHPPPDRLQPPPELLRVHLGGVLRVPGEDRLLVPPGQGLALARGQEGVTRLLLLLGVTPGPLALEHRGLCQDGLTSEFMLTLLQMSMLDQDIKTERTFKPTFGDLNSCADLLLIPLFRVIATRQNEVEESRPQTHGCGIHKLFTDIF